MRNASLVLLGAASGVALTIAATEPHLVLADVDARLAPATRKYQLLKLFVGAFERVRADYVEKPDTAKLIYSAINGMLSGLENSSFVDANSLQGRVCTSPGCALPFGGVGLELTMVDGLAEVVAPIDGSPAAKAGVMARDIIAQIDGDPIQGLSFFQVVNKLPGPPGTEIRLKIVRPGRDNPIEIAIVRDVVTLRTVRGRGENGDIGYIRINQFYEGTADQLKTALGDIAAQIAPERLKGYVLDLRNNPGGLLDQAVAVADAFLEEGEILSVHGRKPAETQRFHAKPGDLTNGKPVIVLINAGSAAAAEVVAGALKDNRRATIVGTRSFGKGSVLTSFPLGPGLGAIRLTTGHYFTPSGRLIAGNGILPDMEVRQDAPDGPKPSPGLKATEQPDLQSYIPPDPQTDKALNAAYALLHRSTAHAP